MDSLAVEAHVEPTEHPHIVRVRGIVGGRPVIAGSRISVAEIASLYKAGEPMDDIVRTYPHLSAAAVYDALSYYLDHQADIEAEIAANRLEAITSHPARHVDERGFIQFSDNPPSR